EPKADALGIRLLQFVASFTIVEFISRDIVFKYNNASHNVYKVTGDEFNICNVPSNNSLGLFIGNDKINLAAAGKKWYICGITGHCNQGVKLKITVLDGTALAPSIAASTLLALIMDMYYVEEVLCVGRYLAIILAAQLRLF
ncbi:hypothetical protein Gotur_011385, partial [Gossypium turneri]